MSSKISVRSKTLWITLCALLITVMSLTMLKDLWLTGQRPNILFYLLVPLADILGTTGAIYAAARIFKQPLTLLQILAVILSVSILMQVMEIITKILYYKVWQYPGMLYLGVNISLSIALGVYGLSNWAGLRWKMALALTLCGFIGSLIVVGVFTSLTGLSTPGS